MSVRLVLRKDLEDVVRSKMLWAILAMFVFLMGVIAVGAAGGGAFEEAEAVDMLPLFVNLGAGLLVPVAAIFVGYLSIAGERQSGSLRMLFGLGHGRDDVFVGKLLSRTGAILAVTAVSLAVTAALMLGTFGEVPLGTFAAFAALTVLLAVALTAIAVGVSASTGSRYRAMGGSIGAYLLFVLFWYPIVAGLHYVVEGSRPGYEVPAWYLGLQLLNPVEAYRQAVMMLTDRTAFVLVGWENVVADLGEAGAEPGALAASERVAGEAPFYLSEPFAALVLVAWIALAAGVGYWQFQRSDLG